MSTHLAVEAGVLVIPHPFEVYDPQIELGFSSQ